MNSFVDRLRGLPRGLAALASHDWSRWHWLLYPTFVFIMTRLLLLSSAYIAEVALPSQTGADYWHAQPDNVLIDSLARWDSAFYLNIVRDGYQFTRGQMSSVAFFPVYPILTSVATSLVGNDRVLAGVWVSHLCLWAALIFFYLLTELEFNDAATARRAVFYIAAFPTAIFFSAVYTESTFLLFSVATVYFARRQNWAWAGIMGMVTSASRIVGVVIWIVVLLEWLRVHGWTLQGILKRDAWLGAINGLRTDTISLLWTCLTPFGLFSYMFFLYRQFGDPIAFWTAQSAWGRGNRGPFSTIFKDLDGILHQNFASGEVWWNSLLNIVVLAAALLIALAVWRRFGAGYAVYSLLGVLIPAMSGTGSLIRYVLVLFPLFMMLAHWGRRTWVHQTLLFAFPIFLGVFTTIFVNWYFLA